MTNLLEKLGLKRTAATQANPQARVDTEAMSIIADVVTIETDLKAAGLRMDAAIFTARNAAESQARAGAYDEARTQLTSLRTKADTLKTQQQAWQAVAGAAATTSNQITDLTTWGDPQAAALRTRADDIARDVSNQVFPNAVTGQGTLQTDVALRHQKWPLVQAHDTAMGVLQPRIAAADAVPGAGVATHPLAVPLKAFQDAKAACPATTTDITVADGLAALRTTLDTAMTTLDTAYTQSRTDWTALATQVNATNTQITELQGWGDPRATPLATTAAEAKAAADGNDFAQAAATFNTIQTEVAQRHPKWRLLQDHKTAMSVLQPRIDAADAVPGAGVAGHPLATELKAFKDAKAACPATTTDMAAADGLAALRTTLDTAMTTLDTAYAQTRTAWTALAPSVKTTNAQIAQMQGWGDARATALATTAAAVKLAADGGDFADAAAKFTPLPLTVPTQHKQAVQLREHTVAMKVIGPRMTVAEQATGQGDPAHALKPLWDAYVAARSALLPVETDPAKAAPLAAARATLSDATEALIDGFKATAPNAWFEDNFQSLESGSSALRQKASYVRPANQTQADLKDKFDRITLPQPTWQAMYEQLLLKVEAAKALLASSGAAGKDEKRFFRIYPKIDERVEAARKTGADAEPLLTAKAAFTAANEAFQTEFFKDPPNYKGCLDIMDDLMAKADAVLKPRMDAARTKITDITAMPTDGTSAIVLQQQKLAKSAAAREAINNEALMDPLTLKSLAPEEQMALLSALRAIPLLQSSETNANDPKRAAQRKVYQAMSLDPNFVAAEKQQRKQTIAALAPDADELKEARDKWTVLTADERKAMLQKMLTAHCTALGCTAPTNGIEIVSLPGDNGHYSPSADAIRVNPDMPVFDDFELASDLIFHENSHNYQFQLVARLDLPAADANRLTKAHTDPPYTQALMFKLNADDNGYVVPDEEYETYQKQPMEDHSWSAGPDISRRLTKAIA